MRSDTRGSTYSAAAAAGIPAILAEIGGQGVWNEDEVEEHMEGVRRVLRFLHVLPGEQPIDESRTIMETFAWIRSEHDGLFHPTVRVGDMVEEGQNVGKVTDYFGKELQRVDAPASGEVVFLVTSLAMNAGDPLLAIVA
jgi:predicted deacylase